MTDMLQPADDICFSLWSKELRDQAHETQLRVLIGLDGCLFPASEQQQLQGSEVLRGAANFLPFTSLNSRARGENRLPLPRLGPLLVPAGITSVPPPLLQRLLRLQLRLRLLLLLGCPACCSAPSGSSIQKSAAGQRLSRRLRGEPPPALRGDKQSCYT